MSSKGIVGILVVLIVIIGGYFLIRDKSSESNEYGGATTTMGTDMDGADTGASSPAVTATSSGDVTGSVTVGKTVDITVTGSSFTFDPKTITVNKGDKVNIHFVNSGGMHDFVIDEFNVRTPRIQGGQTADVSFVASKSGSFEYYCSVGTHRQMGMWGTLTVK